MKKIKTMKSLVKYLIQNNKKISTMESCTGGEIASTITNIEGASNAFEFSAVTYSNEYKIKMGVNKEVINKYSVYSIETANEMSKGRTGNKAGVVCQRSARSRDFAFL